MSKIQKLFGGDRPDPKPLAPIPKRADPAVAAAAKKQKSQALQRKGRKSSILTAGKSLEGDLGESVTQAKATNLGGTV